MEVTIYIADKDSQLILGKKIQTKKDTLENTIARIPNIVSKLIERGFISEHDYQSFDVFFVGTGAFGSEIYEDTSPVLEDVFYRTVAKNENMLLLQSIENEKHWNIADIRKDRFKKVELAATH